MASQVGERRLARYLRTSYLPISTLLVGVATAVLLRSSSGVYVADNRFDQYERPWERFTSSFRSWDAARGLGAAREDVWPGTTLPVALFRGLGAPTWVAERLFHASCLAMFGIGVVALMRLARRRIGVEHLLAALVVMFGPYSASFLVPSNLWFNVAISPWLAFTVVRGSTDGQPWRWAAGCALLIAWAGNPDLPGLAAGVLVMAIAGAWVVLVGATTARRLGAWTARAALLTVLCSAWALGKAFVARDVLLARLGGTESVETAAATSSWSESLRGLGNWLSYFRVSGGLLKPQGEPLLANPAVVVATFAVPIVAFATLAFTRWRPRALFGLFLLCSLVLVVGGFALPEQTPFGRLLTFAMNELPGLGAFRNSYKLAAGLVIGVAVLAAVGVGDARDRLRGRGRKWSALPVASSAVVLFLVSVPFWTGTVYSPAARFDGLPAYWTETFDYLDRDVAGGRVLVLPASSRAVYRWGSVGDDIFEALLDRPHAALTGVPRSTPLAHSALEAITQMAHEPMFRPGVIASMARRLGITEIVIRNDLVWEERDLPRPAAYDALRQDLELDLVATFGEPGLNVTAPSLAGPITFNERSLPPVEVYRVRDADPSLRVASTSDAVLASGDPSSWATMIESGLVAGTTPIWHSGAMNDGELRDVLARGGGFVTTDSNRRRVRMIRGHEPWNSVTLASGQELDRAVVPLFPDDSSMSSAWYPDATEIVAVDGEISQSTVAPHNRPAHAFDRNPATAWAVNPVLSVGQPGVKVTFRSPESVSTIRLSALRDQAGRPTVASVVVAMSDGSVFTVPVGPEGGGVLTMEPRTVTSLSLTLVDFDANAPRVGLGEVVIGDLDLREFIELPTDVIDRTNDQQELAELVERAPTSYAFTRLKRSTAFVVAVLAGRRYDDEIDLRRRFQVSRAGRYSVEGRLSVLPELSDDDVAQLLDQPVTATASTALRGVVRNFAVAAVDGDLDTGWISGTSSNEFMTVQFPSRRVDTVVVSGDALASDGETVLEIQLGDSRRSVRLDSMWDDCAEPSGPSNDASLVSCRFTAEFDSIVPTTADAVTVRFDGSSARLRLTEVSVDGGGTLVAPTTVDMGRALSNSCNRVGLAITDAGGVQREVLGRLSGDAARLLAGDDLVFESCGPFDMIRGWSLLETSGSSTLIDTVTMRSGDWPSSAARAGGVLSGVRGDARAMFATLTATGPTPDLVTVVMPQSFDRRWVVSVDGGREIEASPVDAMSGWSIPVDGDVSLEFRFRGEQTVSVAMWVTVAAVELCVVLWLHPVWRRRSRDVPIDSLRVERRRRSATPLDPTWSTIGERSNRRTAVAIASAGLFGVLVGGLWAIPIAALVAVFAARSERRHGVVVVGAAGPGLLLMAALSSVFAGSSVLGVVYVQSRVTASNIALLSVLVMIHVVALELACERSTRSNVNPTL